MDNERIADIVAEMREGRVFAWEGAKFEGLADRIEAAAERETVASSETQSAVHNKPCVCQTAHNAAKLREAAKAAHYLCVTLNADMDDEEADRLCDVQAYLEEALAAPPRNCDVGSVREQAERWRTWCAEHSVDGYDPCCECPLGGYSECHLEWAQMPYEAPATP